MVDLRGQRLAEHVRKKRGKNGKVCPAIHHDLVQHDFTAEQANRLLPADITEHHTARAS
jgi:hypothetical protein